MSVSARTSKDVNKEKEGQKLLRRDVTEKESSKKAAYLRVLFTIEEGNKNDENIRHSLRDIDELQDKDLVVKLKAALTEVRKTRQLAVEVRDRFRKNEPELAEVWELERSVGLWNIDF